MNAHLRLLAVFITLCPLLVGCGGKSQMDPGLMPERVPTHAPGAGGASVNGSSNAFLVTPGQKDQTLAAKVGDTFEVRIPTIPMDGYTWQPQGLDTHVLRQLGGPVYEPDTNPNAAGGTVVLRFEVIGAGKTPLTLIYASPPGGSAPSFYSDSFGITVDAK